MKLNHAECRERRKRIADFIKAGRTPNEACKEFGVSLSLVHQACREHDIGVRLRVKNRTLHILADLQNTEDSYTTIGARHGMTGSAVGQVRERAAAAGLRIKRRPRHNGKCA